MAIDAYRRVSAVHRRPVLDAAAEAVTFQDVGTVRLHFEPVTHAAERADLVDVEVLSFDAAFDPAADLRPGDILVIGGVEHEVTSVRRPAFLRDHAEATLRRSDIHA